MRPEGVYVVGLGAVTAVGRDPWSSAAAVRARVAGVTEHPYMIDSTGEPMQVALAPWLDIDLPERERFEALLFPAVEQALATLEESPDGAIRLALALGLPAARPGVPANLEVALRASIAARFEDRFGLVAMFDVGHAAGFVGMLAALMRMDTGVFDACVVAGVESYLAPDSLAWLEENGQLHGAGRAKNAWGFVPGEAAGAVLLAAESVVDRFDVEPFARVLSVGEGREEKRIKTQTVCIGEGLTAAFRDSLTGLPDGAKVTDVYCDLNGEPYRADEFGFASLRTADAFESASDFVAPADCWGDVSAASAPLGIMLSAIAAQNGYANGVHALVWASSEGGERGAALLLLPEFDRE
jgi:3-oxoacyl-[acyl-carrier-protein] synthase I